MKKKARESNSLSVMEFLLTYNLDIREEEYEKLLIDAIKLGNERMAILLVKKMISINSISNI